MPGWLGWDRDELLLPLGGTTPANTTVAVGPEGLFAPLADTFRSAAHTVDLSLYTFEHPVLAEILAEVARRGVRVRILLEGSPPGGITDLQRWCVATIAAAGGDIRYMAVQDDAPKGYAVRYRFLHAKYGIIDGRLAFVGTENLSLDAMPVPTDEPVGGRRGFYLFTDAGPVVAALNRLRAADWRPDRFRDLFPYTPEHPRYGDPPADFVLPEPPFWPVTASPFGAAATFSGPAQYVVASAPENALRPDAGLHQLLQRAGAGDEIYLVQLYEHRNWGDTTSNPVADPNPRLELLLAAARRGAKVRLLLDSYFDEPENLRSNVATAAYVRALAAAENLDVEVRRSNPTLGGIHAKVALVRIGDERWSAVGSLNGGEVSHKLNREVMLLTDLAGVYARIHEVFAWDWERGVP
jgi:phosphatidylserine/phosphatidylglycerophosphate/cardiolipin synthase-like enzyme